MIPSLGQLMPQATNPLTHQWGKGGMLLTTNRKSVTGFRNNALRNYLMICNRSSACFPPDLAPVICWMHWPEIFNRAFTCPALCVDFTVPCKILAHSLLILQAAALTSLPHLTGCFHKTCRSIMVFESSVPFSAWSSKLSKWTQRKSISSAYKTGLIACVGFYLSCLHYCAQ